MKFTFLIRNFICRILVQDAFIFFVNSFDLYIKFLLVLGVWWLFFMLALLEWDSLVYISRTFHVIEVSNKNNYLLVLGVSNEVNVWR